MTLRAWCVEHDRSAEFKAGYPARRMCWVGLSVPPSETTPCRVGWVNLTLPSDGSEAQPLKGVG